MEETLIEPVTRRPFRLDVPEDLRQKDGVTLLLCLHGGGLSAAFQRNFFPAHELCEKYRLVVATPEAAEPSRRWDISEDEVYLQGVAEEVFARLNGARASAFWLVGHSQGGVICNSLLFKEYFSSRVDGWLSLAGGRIGGVDSSPLFNEGPNGRTPNRVAPVFPVVDGLQLRPGLAAMPATDISFVFAAGELEIAEIPSRSPLAERYGATKRRYVGEVVDERAGHAPPPGFEDVANPVWSHRGAPGRAKVYDFPETVGGRLVADIVRIGKGHVQPVEPGLTEAIVAMIVKAPGGRART